MANKDFNLNSFCLDDYLDFLDGGSKKKKKKKGKKGKDKKEKKKKGIDKYSKEYDDMIENLYDPKSLMTTFKDSKDQLREKQLETISIAKQVIEAAESNIEQYASSVYVSASGVILDAYRKEKEDYLNNKKSEEENKDVITEEVVKEENKKDKKSQEPKKEKEEKKKSSNEKKKDKKKNNKHDNDEDYDGPMSILIR